MWAEAYLQEVSRKEMFTSQWVWTLWGQKQKGQCWAPRGQNCLLRGPSLLGLSLLGTQIWALSSCSEGWEQVGKGPRAPSNPCVCADPIPAVVTPSPSCNDCGVEGSGPERTTEGQCRWILFDR